jgi:CBS domain-containing protein
MVLGAEHMSKPISSIMSKQTVCVAMDDTVSRVEDILRGNKLSVVPVLEAANGAVLGMISARDLMRFHVDKKDPALVRAWEICSYKPLEVGPDMDISEVANLMVTSGIHHILVTQKNTVVGIVSALDFVRQFIQ